MTSEKKIRELWTQDPDGQINWWLEDDPLMLRDMAIDHIQELFQIIDRERQKYNELMYAARGRERGNTDG